MAQGRERRKGKDGMGRYVHGTIVSIWWLTPTFNSVSGAFGFFYAAAFSSMYRLAMLDLTFLFSFS